MEWRLVLFVLVAVISAFKKSTLENACKSAGLKLVRFQAKSGYQVQAVREQIDIVLNPLDSKESLNQLL